MEYTSEVLYAESSSGKIKQWEINVVDDNARALLICTHGYIDGQLQTSTKIIKTGKNIGKSNETSYLEQAILEAKSKVEKKRDKGYQEDSSTISTPILPMLALPFEKRKHNIQWPSAIQPKIDGIRCTCHWNGEQVIMFTRKGKPFTTMPHIEYELEQLLKNKGNNFYLDGELYSDTLTFQELAGTVRRQKNDSFVIEQVYLIIFDCFDTDNLDIGFKERWKILKDMFEYYQKPSIKLIETLIGNNEEHIREKHNDYIEQGYEGIIVRNVIGKYKLGHRSADLQKLKSFLDSEYTIIAYKEGEGVEAGCAIWQCETEDGSQRFWARPKGTRDERQQLFNTGDKYLGKLLTVRYQELTDDGIPRFPVGVSIRDYE